MEKKKLLERTKVLLAVILALVVVFCYFLMGRTSAVKGLNTGTAKLFFPREQSRGKAVLCFIRNLTPGFLGIMIRFMANMGCGEDMRAIFICRGKIKREQI